MAAKPQTPHPIRALHARTNVARVENAALLFLQRCLYYEHDWVSNTKLNIGQRIEQGHSERQGDDDLVHGCLCIVSDDTDRIIGERRLVLLRTLTSRLAGAAGADEIFTVRDYINSQSHDLPFTLTYLFSLGGNVHG